MNIILLTNFCKRHGSLEICLTSVAVWAGLAFVLTGMLMAWAGYELGQRSESSSRVQAASEAVRSAIAVERDVLNEARKETQAHMDALAIRIAELQAHLMRVDAVGERLVKIGKLDADEFNFSEEPAVGGIEHPSDADSQSVSELEDGLAKLEQLLEDRDNKLTLLEDILLERKLIEEVTPSGRPIKKGWLSSHYGKRTDPFSGKKTFHRGVDFAGKRGSDVVAVAAGLVVRSEMVSGYGNLIEIRHADGYLTRYAHNQKNLVKVGDLVEKGQTIALLGSTGRSNGPHVHFEVRKNNKTINPRRFIQQQG